MQSPKNFPKVLVFVKDETDKTEDEGSKKLWKDISVRKVDELVNKIKGEFRIENVKTLEYFDEDFKAWVEVSTLDDIPSTPKLRVITANPSIVQRKLPNLPVPVAAKSSREPTPIVGKVGSSSNFPTKNVGSTAEQRNPTPSAKPNWAPAPTVASQRERSSLVGAAKLENNTTSAPVTIVPKSTVTSTAFHTRTPAKEPWKWEQSFLQKQGWVNKGNSGASFKAFSLKEGTKILDNDELKKVEHLFATCLKGSLFEIDKVHAIQNQSLETQFELTAQKIKTRIEQSPHIFNQKLYKQDANADWREAIIDSFNQYAESFAHNQGNGVKIVPVAHGTQESSAWSVCQTGFATLGWTDSGYFGKGLYFSEHAEYSALCYGDNSAKPDEYVLLICWVAVGNPFPCIENPFEKDSLKGGGAKSGYDAHYTVVKPYKDEPNTKVYVPCEPNLFQTKRTFSEYVIFQEGQVLPRYILTVKKKSISDQALVNAMKRNDEEAMKSLMRTFIDIYLPVGRITDKAKWQNDDLLRSTLERLDKYLDNPEMLFLLCSTLWLLSRIDENKPKLVSSGAIPLSCAILKKYQDQPRLIERALHLLYNLMFETTAPKALAENFGLALIINTVRNLMDDAQVVEQACAVLRHVASKADMQIKLAEQGCIAAVINALNIHKLHAGVQKGASALLWHITMNEANRVTASQQGAIHALLDAIQNNKRIPEAQEYICGALAHMALPAQNQVLIASLGGIPLLLNVLKNHLKHEGVCHKTLRALCYLALNDKNQNTIVQAGGIADIINTMHEHQASAGVSEMGCSCLGYLAKTEQNTATIVQNQGLLAVVCAMGAFRDRESLQERAMYVLQKLIENSSLPVANLPFGYAVNIDREGRLIFIDHQTTNTTFDWPAPSRCSPMNVITFVQAGVLNSVLATMLKFSNKAKIQEQSCRILLEVCNHDADLSAVICSLNGVQIIINTATSHKTNANLIEMATKVLYFCSSLEENRVSVAQHGAITFCISNMREWASNACICAETCSTLMSLSFHDNNRTMMFQAGVIPVVISMLKTHVADLLCQEQGLVLLRKLTVPNKMRQELAKQGGIALVLQAMTKFPDGELLIESGIVCLWNFHIDSENLSSIKKGKQLLATAKSKFPQNNMIQDHASKMLPKL